MKVRVTLMTENDKHLDLPQKDIEIRCKLAWQMLCELLNNLAEDESEKATLESVEVVEN